MSLILEADLKEEAKIQRRRQNEAERRKRIFNPKQRLIGLDKEMLDKQVAEKKERESEEKNVDDQYNRMRLREDEIVCALEKKVNEERRKIEENIKEFREIYQRNELRREFDLNDKEYKKKSLPCRLHDNDPRCTVSSAQKFDGEDLLEQERLKIQKEQTKSWLEQQIREKEQADNQRLIAEKMHEEALLMRDKRAVELERFEEECKRQIFMTMCRYNKALADEQRIKKEQRRVKEEQDKLTEKVNWITSDLLTENPEAAISNFGPNRKIGSMYKGQSPEEKKQCLDERKRQVLENEIKRIQEKEMELSYNKLSEHMAREIYLKEQEVMKKQRELDHDMMKINKCLSHDQKVRKLYLDKEVYGGNIPTEKYYEQFNSTTR